MADEDPRIAELIRAGRRRRALIAAVVGVLAIVAGAILLVVLLTGDADLANRDGLKQGGGYQLIVLGGGIVLIGIGSLVGAVRMLRRPDAG